ncbi:DNA-processing protein DprA [Lacticaseibacillus camelliae]|uniref:Rossmann fold nucleotide-binding protein for DNA uptake n=1 Tax=Lacticaseibacillus camelliae DSM 22697 = JCM 13995 TaxID=1423730 RepID=A0A0R2EXE5_9LACO|nr:Rossmann fold nucleotide-binding protein for DNA uptake [Lacticaseibacillus camelliae DSM 22697 = JCM 13995]
MKLRELMLLWHWALYTKSWQTEQRLWDEITRRGLTADNPVTELSNWRPLQEIRPYAEDAAWLATVRQYCRTGLFVTRFDPTYPERLAESNQPPLVLFYRGRIDLLDNMTLAVVGARRATSYTETALRRLGETLPPLVILSGLAAGADGMAHRFALSKGWPTVAVIATGLDVTYPPVHHQLQQLIAENGLVLSEYPPGTQPQKFQFVARNRIIAGLAHGVLVTEAAAHSGSLITANYALQNNREVLALPNRIDAPTGEGSNLLIQAGAKLVTTGQDIADELHFFP